MAISMGRPVGHSILCVFVHATELATCRWRVLAPHAARRSWVAATKRREVGRGKTATERSAMATRSGEATYAATG